MSVYKPGCVHFIGHVHPKSFIDESQLFCVVCSFQKLLISLMTLQNLTGSFVILSVNSQKIIKRNECVGKRQEIDYIIVILGVPEVL